MSRYIKLGRWGLLENPVGFHVEMPWQGRTLLGEVVAIDQREYRGTRSTHLKVKYFNGEPWPVDPVVTAVKVLGMDEPKQRGGKVKAPRLTR